jgi:DNA polymerase
MALDSTKPPISLDRELREVAQAASALTEYISKQINIELPDDFPTKQLVQIAYTLERLTEGTAEGCRAQLGYARNRLPAIRREHIRSDEGRTGDPDEPPPILRRDFLDQRLAELLVSVTTALDEYRRLASEEWVEEGELPAGVPPPAGATSSASSEITRLDQGLRKAQETVQEATVQNSQPADDLKRQLHDASGLNRLARIEISMPRVVGRWLRETVSALRNYPLVIRKTANKLKVGADITQIGVERWHDFERDLSKFLFDQFRRTCTSLEKVAARLEKQRRKQRQKAPPEKLTDPIAAARDAAKSAPTLELLKIAVERFEGCALRATAKTTVFSDGNPNARIMFVGEAPGRDEDDQGIPFVARSGKLLDLMMNSVGLDRSTAYLSNVIPWRPPGNRTPTPQECQICLPFIQRQIELADPDILVCLGGPTTQLMLGTNEGIKRSRGKWFAFHTGKREIRAIATFHPAYLLRAPLEKRFAWRDFLAIKKALDGR